MTPEQLLNHMKSFKYKIYIENGKQYVQQPENLEKTKIGTCYDQSLYIYDKLTKANYSCKLIFFTNSTLTITHSFVLFEENNNTYWIENAYEKFTGIHKVDNGYLDVLKVWAKDEKINPNDVAVNDNVDTNKLLINKNLTYTEYIKIVTEPFLTKEDVTMEQYTKVNDIVYTQPLITGLEALNIQNLPNIKTWYFATQDEPYDQFTISNTGTTMELSSTNQTFYPFCKMTNINKIDTETFPIFNFETKSFNDLYLESKKIKELLRTVELTDNSGQENFVVDGIVRLFSGIVNIVMHIVNTFKTNIFKFYKNLKRTELRYFHESNVASIRRILSFDYELLSQMQVPVPDKLGTTYYAATEAGMNCLSVMNMKERSMAFVSLTNNLKTSILSGQTIEIMEFGDQTDLGNIQKSFQKFNLCFTGRKTNTIDFATVFPTMEEFKNTDMLLMKSENYQYEVNEINNNLEACEARMNEILSFLNQGVGNISKQDLIVLSDTCMTLAKLFDLYGVTIQDITRLEHNFTLILKQIKHQFNL